MRKERKTVQKTDRERKEERLSSSNSTIAGPRGRLPLLHPRLEMTSFPRLLVVACVLALSSPPMGPVRCMGQREEGRKGRRQRGRKEGRTDVAEMFWECRRGRKKRQEYYCIFDEQLGDEFESTDYTSCTTQKKRRYKYLA